MNNIRQRLRPKHQILILKCYPRFQKTAADVKPNSSELSYLLYYASTRRSKLQKVGDFLQKKTESDVHKGRLGNVHVTLQILTALIEKCPRDLPLYISAVFFVLGAILKTHDINLVEESLPAFAALCAHYDSATLAADQENTRQYDAIIQTYATYASRSAPPRTSNRNTSIPEAIRFRSAGLQAVRGLVSSDSFAADSGKHLNVVMPVILENLYSENAKYLSLLRHRESSNEHHEKEQHQRLRQSISIQRATDSMEADPSVAAGTAADVDQRAEEDVGVLALQSLRQIFTADNRGQVRTATKAILSFTISRVASAARPADRRFDKGDRSNWATELFEMICRWTPVQDRFVILVTATESLIRSPIVEKDLPNQIELTRVIGWLLRSNINFIGLSVMDVLIGLIQHILLLLQLGGQGSGVSPHPQQTIGLSDDEIAKPGNSGAGTNAVVMEVVATPSTPRVQLLDQLHNCVGSLATHVYYSDQIGDMLSAILRRLKPSTASSIPNAAAAVANPIGAADAIAGSINIHENPNTADFFSFDTARSLALQAVTNVLVVANLQRTDGANAVGRNRVDISVWDGTQWLLRDPDGKVRKAYVEALITWLQLEVNKMQLNLAEDVVRATRSKIKDKDPSGSPVARRATSNASQRIKTQRKKQSTFLDLLHLAIYENALQYAESETDILLLHSLLANLVEKLGINSIRIGLSMIFRLQDDMQIMDNPQARIGVGSLVHGYFWALTEIFDFDRTLLGQDIHREITRRIQQHLWLNKIRMPPTSLEQLGTPSNADFRPNAPVGTSENNPLRPFDDRPALVDAIADGYANTLTSAPTSPVPSPGRSFSVPALFANNQNPNITVGSTLPPAVTEQMLEPWTKEDCLARILTHEKSKASSIGGASNSHRNYLNVLNNNNNFASPSSGSPGRQGSLAGSSVNGRARSATNGPIPTAKGSPAAGGPGRHASVSSLQTPATASSASHSVVRVAELKRVLEGGYAAPLPLSGPHITTQEDESESGDEECLLDADPDSESLTDASSGSLGEGFGEGAEDDAQSVHVHAIGTAIQVPTNTTSIQHPRQQQYPIVTRKYSYTPGETEDIPPVPLLPAGLRKPSQVAALVMNEPVVDESFSSLPQGESPAYTFKYSQPQSHAENPARKPSNATSILSIPPNPPNVPATKGIRASRSVRSLKPGSVKSMGTAGTGRRLANAPGGTGGTGKVDVGKLLSGIEETERARMEQGKGRGRVGGGGGRGVGAPPY